MRQLAVPRHRNRGSGARQGESAGFIMFRRDESFVTMITAPRRGNRHYGAFAGGVVGHYWAVTRILPRCGRPTGSRETRPLSGGVRPWRVSCT